MPTPVHSSRAPQSLPIDVFVDFDGTIAPDDATDSLLAKFADPFWLEIEAEWQSGKITSAEAMDRQIRLIRATPEQIKEFIAGIGVDPAFPEFVEICRAHGARVSVVSDGMDLLVGSVLKAAGLDLPYRANKLEWQGGDRWLLKFPYRKSDCRMRMGNCKCSHGNFTSIGMNVMVGDGRSDFCIAERCDLILAKSNLIKHCQQNDIDHVPITGFAEANVAMRDWLKRSPSQQRRVASTGQANTISQSA